MSDESPAKSANEENVNGEEKSKEKSQSPERASKSPDRALKSPERVSKSPDRAPKSREQVSKSPERKDDRSPKRRRDDSPRRRDERSPKRRRERSPERSRRRSRSPRRRRRRSSDDKVRAKSPEREVEAPVVPRKPKRNEDEAKVNDLLTTRTGGAYIPPAKLRMMMANMQDKSSKEYQRLAWEQLRKKMHGLVNKANVDNLPSVVRDLFKYNIIRAKGILARSIIQAQAFSPTFSHVYAALVAVINSKFPQNGELILRRLIIQFKRSFKRNDKAMAATACKFIAHLINQQVAHEILALEILTLLLEEPTDDSVEVAIAFLKECGAKLTDVTPRGVQAIFDRMRGILQDTEGLDVRVQYMIEVLMHVRKAKFEGHVAVPDGLDLIDEDDQITHTLSLEEAQDPETLLNVFRLDDDYEKNEEVYNEIRLEILGDSDDEDGDDSDEEEEEEQTKTDLTIEVGKTGTIMDNTEAQLVAFRRLIYLTLQSSLDYQEACHKLLKLDIQENMYDELVHMIIDCCAEKRTYEKFFGLLAERLCRLRTEFQNLFESCYTDIYSTIHRFEITKLRNTTRLYGHLLFTDAIKWETLQMIRLNEDETTSASRIFIKILFQELSEFMGLEKLYERIRDPTLQIAFDGIFPRNNPRDTRFSINFFTSIGLGGLTVDLREHLKNGPKEKKTGTVLKTGDSSSSSSSDSDSSSSSSSSDSSDSSDDEKSDDSAAARKRMMPPVAPQQPGGGRRRKALDIDVKDEPPSERRRDDRREIRRSPPRREHISRRSPSPPRRRRRDSGDDRRRRHDDGERRRRHYEDDVKQEPPSERATR